MGLFEGLLGGFNARKQDVEQRNFALGQQQSQKEAAIFSHLMTADDPEVRTLALTGLLDSANPRRKAKGLAGWIGQTESSPYLKQISDLVNTPITEPNPAVGAVPAGATLPGATLPSRQSAAGVGLPSVQPSITEPQATGPTGQPSAGMSTNAPVQGTGAPPTPVSYTQSQATPFTTTRMRSVFLSGADKIKADAQAKASGNLAGMRAELSPFFGDDQTNEIIKRSIERQYGGAGAVGSTYAEGNTIPDPKSPTGYSQLLYQRGDPTKQLSIPALDPTRAHTNFYGKDLEAISGEPGFGGKPFGSQDPEGKARVNAEFQRRQAAQAGAVTTARETAQNDAFTKKWLTSEQAAQQGVPVGTSLADLAGIKPVTPDQLKRKQAVDALAPQISEIAGLIKAVIPPGLNALQASEVIASKRLRKDPDMARLEGALNRAVGNIARVLNAESGRLTQQDVERASKSLADISGWADPQETALARLEDVGRAVERVTADLKTPGEVLQGRQGTRSPGASGTPVTGAPPAPAGATGLPTFGGPVERPASMPAPGIGKPYKDATGAWVIP